MDEDIVSEDAMGGKACKMKRDPCGEKPSLDYLKTTTNPTAKIVVMTTHVITKT